jgi:hypothetical protein
LHFYRTVGIVTQNLMMRRSYRGSFLAVLAGGLCAIAPAIGETNRPAAAPPPTPDSQRFFEAYGKAINYLREKKPQREEAVIVMDQISRQANTSPWMEISLLKYSELIEPKNNKAAVENYQLLRSRAQNAPYFQSDAPYARVFRAALEGATANGVNRIRINRIREALSSYFARYSEYPESLAKLAILGYIDMENIQNVEGRSFRYTPTGVQLTPFISYKRYEPLDCPPAEPFYVTTPSLEGTSQISSSPPKYAALLKMSGKAEAVRVVENQTVGGFLVCTISPEGAILCTTERILILPVLPPAPPSKR